MEKFDNFNDLRENVINFQAIIDNLDNERRERDNERRNRINQENERRIREGEIADDINLYEAMKVVLNEANAAMNEAEINVNAVTQRVGEIENKTNVLKSLYYNKMQGLIDALRNDYIPNSEQLVVDILDRYVLSNRENHYSENLDDFSAKFRRFPEEIKNICDTICVEMNECIIKIRDEIQPRYDECGESYERINAVEKKLNTILKETIRYRNDRRILGIYVERTETLIRDLESKIEELKRYKRNRLSRFFQNIFPEGIADELRENVRNLQKGEGVPKKILDLFHDEGSDYENIDIPIQFKIGPDIHCDVSVKYLEGLPIKDILNRSEKFYKAYVENALGYFKRMLTELNRLKNEI